MAARIKFIKLNKEELFYLRWWFLYGKWFKDRRVRVLVSSKGWGKNYIPVLSYALSLLGTRHVVFHLNLKALLIFPVLSILCSAGAGIPGTYWREAEREEASPFKTNFPKALSIFVELIFSLTFFTSRKLSTFTHSLERAYGSIGRSRVALFVASSQVRIWNLTISPFINEYRYYDLFQWVVSELISFIITLFNTYRSTRRVPFRSLIILRNTSFHNFIVHPS